jgi:hypothetical protein
VIPGRLDVRVADQIVAENRGNPLALIELTRGLSPAQLAAGVGWVGGTSLSGRIEESFQQRLEVLPGNAQEFLSLASADPSGDPALVFRAAERLRISGPAIELAVLSGLIEINGTVRFCHPLGRSAVYRAARPDQRRRVHRVLAEATDAQVDPTGVPGIWPRRPPAWTRTSPPSSSGRQAEPRHGAGWQPRPHFWSEPPR